MSNEWVVDGVKAPEWATGWGKTGMGEANVWFSDDKYQYFDGCTVYGYGRPNRTPEDIKDRLPRPKSEPVFQLAKPDRIAAHEFLERGAQHMRDRAASRDAPDGERSMARCVAAFNAQEGTNLTEAQGWRFMIQLKYARSIHGSFVADDYEDLCAYAGLAGEAAQ